MCKSGGDGDKGRKSMERGSREREGAKMKAGRGQERG